MAESRRQEAGGREKNTRRHSATCRLLSVVFFRIGQEPDSGVSQTQRKVEFFGQEIRNAGKLHDRNPYRRRNIRAQGIEKRKKEFCRLSFAVCRLNPMPYSLFPIPS